MPFLWMNYLFDELFLFFDEGLVDKHFKKYFFKSLPYWLVVLKQSFRMKACPANYINGFSWQALFCQFLIKKELQKKKIDPFWGIFNYAPSFFTVDSSRRAPRITTPFLEEPKIPLKRALWFEGRAFILEIGPYCHSHAQIFSRFLFF